MIVADVIVLVVTWRSTFHLWRRGKRLGMNLPITTCLMRDGTVYFLVLLGMNTIDLLVTLAWQWRMLGLEPVVIQLPPVVVSRFLLGLRSCAERGCTVDARVSSVVFAGHSVLGDIGAPLGYVCGDERSFAPDGDAQDTPGAQDSLSACTAPRGACARARCGRNGQVHDVASLERGF
ncbi:hypothetical protein PsYK624_145080 [Phanerochaete sordida]|uniref:Uncharacterized protein n=1 Tax=Phanerochaete sordida TaxID=48140 RepID=A0A9P3GMS1_9APHY|nr:hypothetical protein PsYK624_145080 [Phanerochaete sordida]